VNKSESEKKVNRVIFFHLREKSRLITINPGARRHKNASLSLARSFPKPDYRGMNGNSYGWLLALLPVMSTLLRTFITDKKRVNERESTGARKQFSMFY
jgi:hypothetical protein